jgi:hypothetical protein
METNSDEVKAGWMWFIGSFIVATSLTIALLKIDDGLTFSSSEVDKGELLKELRTAQFEVAEVDKNRLTSERKLDHREYDSQ